MFYRIILFSLLCASAVAQKIDCTKLYQEWENKTFSSVSAERSDLLRRMELVKNDMACYVSLYRFLGFVHQKEGKLDSAILVYTRAAKMFDSLHVYIGVGSSYNEIANVYSELKNYKEALRYFKLTLNCFETHKIPIGICDATHNMAELYYVLDSLQLAEKYCKRSIVEKVRYNITIDLIGTFNLLSYIYLDMGRKDLAIAYVSKAVAELPRVTDLDEKVNLLNRFGEIYFRLGQFEKSNYYLRDAYRIAKLQNDESLCALVEENMVKYFEGTQRYDSALKYSKLKDAYRQKIAGQELSEAVANASVKYETEKKELELKNQEQETASSRKLNALLGAALVLMLVLIFFLARFYSQKRRIQKKEAELERANALIKGQDAERERIAAELHDRVGSMLSAAKLQFSVLLDGDGSEQESGGGKRAMEMLDESYEEVRRISHDLDTGLLSRFGLHAALAKLARVIESTSKIKVNYIDNGVRGELTKDMQTEVYRITQELFSNTIKYARATEVNIQISMDGQNIVYSYEDDGIGFDKALLEKPEGIGYRNIETRVKRVKGKLHVETSPGNGTIIIIEMSQA